MVEGGVLFRMLSDGGGRETLDQKTAADDTCGRRCQDGIDARCCSLPLSNALRIQTQQRTLAPSRFACRDILC